MSTTYNLTGLEYSSAKQFALERERIFNRAWQLIGGAAPFAQPGSYLSTDIAGTPIFVLRGQDDVLRGFKNICPHRGMPLFKDKAGRCSEVVCPYHAAQFDDTGALHMRGDWFGQPVPEQLKGLHLTPVSVEEWRGLVFAAFDPFEPLLEQLGDLASQVGKTPIQSYTHFERRQFTFEANWKSYFDQYNELWHTPNVHPSDKNIGIQDYRAEPMQGLIRMTTGSEEGAQGAYYGGKWMQCWPNWTLVLFEGGMKTSRINPLSATQFEAYLDFWFEDASPEAEAKSRKAADATVDIFLQDAALCERVLPSYQCGSYVSGPMHPTLDRAVIEYHARIRRALG